MADKKISQLTSASSLTGNEIVPIDQTVGSTTTTVKTTTQAIANLVAGGVPGPQGIQGPIGPTGATGPAGAIGPAGLTWKGTWAPSTSYVANDAVGYNGASYFCIVNTSGTLNPVADTTHWALLASQGAPGPTGATGPQGPQGPPGTSGWSLTGNALTNSSTNFIGTTDAQDLILKTNNLERIKVYGTQTYIDIKGSAYATNGSTYTEIAAYSNNSGNYSGAKLTNTSGSSGSLMIWQGTSNRNAELKATNLTATRAFEFPDTGGTLAIEDYKVYTALISANSGSPTVKVLKNTLGVSINWTNPFNGIIDGIAASGTPFTADKTWISSGSYDSGGYFATSTRVGGNQVRYKFIFHDGTVTGTPNFVDFSIEIRVYN